MTIGSAGVAYATVRTDQRLRATASCRGDNLVVKVTSGDGPFRITGGGPHLPGNLPGIALPETALVRGPGTWTDVTVREREGDRETKVVADAITCPSGGSGAAEIQLADGATPIANAATLTFPPTAVGVPVTKTLTITNLGTAPLTLGIPAITPGFKLNTLAASPIAPGASTTTIIRCDAVINGTTTGTLQFATNDADENLTKVTLSCTAGDTPPPPPTAPEIQLFDLSRPIPNAGTLDLGLTVAGTPVARTLSIANQGTATLTLGTPSPISRFSLTSAMPTSVPPADSRFVVIACNATTPGTYTEMLSFATNDADENPTTVTLTCLVTASAVQLLDGATPIPNGGTFNVGTTTYNADITKTLTIANPGTATLTLGDPNAASIFPFSLQTPFPTTITPGGSATVTIRCIAVTPGTKTQTLTFTTSAGPVSITLACTVNSVARFRVQLEGADVANGATINLGTMLVRGTIHKTISFSNPGNLPLNFTIDASNDSPIFISSTSSPIDPGETKNRSAVCVSGVAGHYTNTFTYTTNDPANPTFVLTLTCDVQDAAIMELYLGSTISGGIPLGRGAMHEVSNCHATLTIRNHGSVPLVISDGLAGFPLPMTVGPAETFTFGRDFTVGQCVPGDSTTITFTTNDPLGPFTVTLVST